MEEGTEESNPNSTSSEFLEKLKRALSHDGDFPASARVVSELRETISNPESTTNQVAEIILREPSLGTRVLSLVNSSFYRRAKPIMTVSQAVIQIGMRPLAELCSGLILLQKFIPAARSGGPFAKCLKRSITTSLLTSSLSRELKAASLDESVKKNLSKDETGYLAGLFAEMGILLLAYYFPKLYESAEKRSESKSQPLDQSIQELVGLGPLEISREVLSELELPEIYRELLAQSAELSAPTAPTLSAETARAGSNPSETLLFSLFAGRKLSTAINEEGSREALETAIAEVNSTIPLDSVLLSHVLGSLQDQFSDHCLSLELKLPQLPPELKELREQHEKEKEVDLLEEAGAALNEEEQFANFVEEIRFAVENREPTASVITTVMETFAWSLGFDRVLLLLLSPGRKQLVGRMLLGNIPDFDPKAFSRSIGKHASPHAPDAIALNESRPIFRGDPLFDEGWPFAAVPVGYDKKSIGIIYADRTNDSDQELSAREEAAISVLAELLDRSISLNS